MRDSKTKAAVIEPASSGSSPKRPHPIQAEFEKHARHHSHDDRHGQQLHDLSDQSGQPEHQQQDAGRQKGADHLLEAEVCQGGSHQHGSGYGPEKRQRLPVDDGDDNAEDAVEGEAAEHPRRQLGLRQPALETDTENDRDRRRGGKQERDQRIAGVNDADVSEPGSRTRSGFFRFFELHVFATRPMSFRQSGKLLTRDPGSAINHWGQTRARGL